MISSLTIATRESPLALWQANWVKDRLMAHHPRLRINLLGLTTSGDTASDVMMKTGGKGLFVKELEEALLDKRADIAVHSMKDVPMILPPEFDLTVICERDDPRDAFVSNHYRSLDELPLHARIGTASVRRQSQLLALRPDLHMETLRGNVNTRLSRLDRQDFDAIILAAAGLKRLTLESRIQSFLDVEQSLPAPGQGALGIECRKNDPAILQWIQCLHHETTSVCVAAERAMCEHLNGGCHTPIAAFAAINNNQIMLKGRVLSLDGKQVLLSEKTASLDQATAVGICVAEDLLRQGARAILDAI